MVDRGGRTRRVAVPEKKQDPTSVTGSVQPYEPPDWAWHYVLAVLDVEVKPTISERCAVAGVRRNSYYDAVKDPRFVTWINDAIERVVIAEGPEVRAALRRKCLAGDIEAIKFWYEIYGKYIPTSRSIVKDERDLTELTDAELAKIARVLAYSGTEGTGEKVH